MSADAADSSVDMDRLNRNMPEYGRQTRQVLQVSVCVLFQGGRGSGGDGERKKKRNESEKGETTRGLIVQNLATHCRKILSNIPILSVFQCGSVLSHTQGALSSCDNWTY